MAEEDVFERLLTWCASRVGHKEVMNTRFSLYVKLLTGKLNFDIIKVTGTNGKGSVVSMLSSCFTKDKKKVGLFTSPHLVSVTERFRVNDMEVPLAEAAAAALKIEALAKKVVDENGEGFIPSYFEVLIMIAIELFNAHNVDTAIFEGGVGGSNDSVSLLPGFLTLVTSVGLDHKKQLGDTPEAVAIDKAGMASDGSTMIVNSMIPGNLKEILRSETQNRNIDFIEARELIYHFETSLKGTLALAGIEGKKIEIRPRLMGYFQKQNLNLLIETWLWLKNAGKVGDVTSILGVENTQWPARFEVIESGPTWILDAAHNVQAFNELIQSLNRDTKKAERVLLFGNSEEKDFISILKLIPEISDTVYFVDDFHKAVPQAALIDNFDAIPVVNPGNSKIAYAVDDIRQRFKDKVIVSAGSIFMVGIVRDTLIKQ